MKTQTKTKITARNFIKSSKEFSELATKIFIALCSNPNVMRDSSDFEKTWVLAGLLAYDARGRLEGYNKKHKEDAKNLDVLNFEIAKEQIDSFRKQVQVNDV